MSETYFSKLPVITYNKFQARNITERVVMITTPRLAAIDFYPYELANNLRSDQLAGNYYQDPNLDWIIYITNKIIDPYYGWHLYDIDFYNYVADKYGDVPTAQQTVAFFRNNWPSDTHQVTVDYFNALDGTFKKYYEPVWGPKQRILGYTRRTDDTTVNTNKIVSFTISMNTANTSFANGELLVINHLGLDVGRMQCVSANATTLVAKNLVDTTDVGEIRSRANTDLTANIASFSTLVENIPTVEGAFWEPVSFYDVEYEANENKRFIDVLDSGHVMDTAESIRKLLNK